MNNRTKIEETIQLLVDEVSDKLQKLFEEECQNTINRWEERWPNHRFTLELNMGRAIGTIEPPFRGESILPVNGRLAAEELNDEFIEWELWCTSLEFPAGLHCTGEIKSNKDNS